MQCPACNHSADREAFGDLKKCPECGAYYHKALAHKQRIEASKPAAAKRHKEKPQPAKPAKPSALARIIGDLKSPKYAVDEGRARPLGYLYCQACGATGAGKSYTKGSIFIELVLWLCFFIPGLIYSIWRLSSRQIVCSTCNNPGLIPTSSPKAKKELGIN